MLSSHVSVVRPRCSVLYSRLSALFMLNQPHFVLHQDSSAAPANWYERQVDSVRVTE